MILKELYEMQDWRNHSGNRSEVSNLVKQIDKLDQQLMSAPKDVENKWEEYTSRVLPEESPYWSELSDNEILSAIKYANKLIDGYT